MSATLSSSEIFCDSVSVCIEDFFNRIVPVLGGVLYVLVVLVIFKGRKTKFRHTFYSMCLSLAAADILGIFNKASAPLLMPLSLGAGAMAIRFHGFVGRYIWYLGVFHHLAIAAQRLAAVFQENSRDNLAGSIFLQIILLACWLIAAAVNVPVLTDVAPQIYNPKIYRFTFNYSIESSHTYQRSLDFGVQPVLCALQMIFYMVAITRLRVARQKIDACLGDAERLRRRKKELSMLLQGFLSFLPIFIVVVCFHIIVFVKLPATAFTVMKTVVDIFGCFVYTGSPVVYLIFNLLVRSGVVDLVKYSCSRVTAIKDRIVYSNGDGSAGSATATTPAPV